MPKLTKQLIEKTPTPATTETYIWDTDLPGFGVKIMPSGRRIYVARYRTRDGKNRQRKMTICRYNDAPPEKARSLARDIFQSVAAGNDPAGERQTVKAVDGLTLEAMFKARVAYMKEQEKTNADEVERVLLLAGKNAADSIGRKKSPGDVTPEDIIKFLSGFYDAGHAGAADKARGYLSAAFNWAIRSANDYTVKQRQDWGIKHNPIASVAKDHNAAKQRDRNLTADEIRAFWIACSDGNAGFTDGTQVCLKMLMACGQRVQETLRIEGADIDIKQRVWNMPARKTKGRKHAHSVPLPDIIIPDLERLIELHGKGTLFPAVHDSSVSGILGSLAVAQAVRRYSMSEECPMPAFQPRDLRRTWKSRAHDAGVDRFTRDLIQQHAKNDTGSKHYDRAVYLPQMREAMDKWNAWLTALIDGTPPAASEPPKLRLVA